MGNFIEQTVADVREQVGNGQVICGLSGGVDSSVVAGPAAQGDRRAARLHLRRQRPAAEERARAGRIAPSATTSRSTCTSSTPREQFLGELDGVTDPQEKRKIIGHEFIDVFKREAETHPRRAASSPRARSTPT